MKHPPPKTGIHLWLLLWKATKAVEAGAQQSVRDAGMGLSDFGVMEALLHKGPLPVNALGKKVLLTSGSMTAAVDRLERRGWVERTTSRTDRRARIVRLTPAGAKVIRRMFGEHVREMEQVFSSLSRAERAMLEKLLRKAGYAAETRAAKNTARIRSQR